MTPSSFSPQPSVLALRAPFPWFGGKSRAAHIIWPRFGETPGYVEPFFGSGAVMLARPHPQKWETINDADCYVANAWRAMKHAPALVSEYCDWPVNEADLHARHTWLHAQSDFRERMKTDPDFYDAKIAAWWIWGLCCWIGGNFCRPDNNNEGRKRPRADASRGVTRQLPVVTCSQGVSQQKLFMAHSRGIETNTVSLQEWFSRLAARLRHTKVCCGDWSRVVTKACTYGTRLTSILLDPPYDPKAGCDNVYGEHGGSGISAAVREWALANGNNSQLRIALCGYEGEHTMPADWECVAWKAKGGYAKIKTNSHRERIWFSPHCLKIKN